MINAADELVTGHQTHQRFGNDQGSRKETAYTTDGSTDGQPSTSKSAEFDAADKYLDRDVSPYPVQETEKLSILELSRFSITSADCVPMIGVQKPQSQQHKIATKQSSYSPVDTQQIKILVVGDRFTGKSSLIQRTTLTATGFCCQYNCTNLLNCSSKTVRHKEKLYSVTIWDLTESTLDHEEKYFKEFCSGAMAAFVVYDLSRLRETLSSIADWKKKIDNTVCKRNGNPIPIYLLGNKCDMEGYQKDGASFVELHKFTDHFRTSAKTGEGIEEAVRAAVKEILRETYPHPPEICETPSYHKIQ